MIFKFREKDFYFFSAQVLCAISGFVTYLNNSRFFSATSLLPKFVLCFLFLAGVIPVIVYIRSKSKGNRTESHFSNLVKKRWLFTLILLTFFLTIALLLSAPEGIKTKYQPLFLRIEPIFVYLLAQSITLIITRIFIQFKESGSISVQKFGIFFVQTYFIPLFIFIFPFLFYFPRTIPIDGSFTGIGNDFIPITYSHKVYLLDYLSNFQIPLWSPGEGAGFPFYSSPHTQTFYPLNIALMFLYKINGGYSVLDHQRFTILGIMIFALGLYFWLGHFKFDKITVISLSLIVPCTFKLAELQRYSLATHSVAWYPWLLYSVTLLFSQTRNRDLWKSACIFCFSLISIITAGYPYYVYYLLFLFIPIIVIFFINHQNTSTYRKPIITKPINFIFLSISIIAVTILTGPYLLKMFQLMNQTSGRSGNTLDYAAGHPFTAMDTLGSIIFPPSAQAEGWYYFGVLLVIILFWFLLEALLDRKSVNRTLASTDRAVVITLLIAVILISWITYGVDSKLFIFLWKYLPFFSSLRTWGRLNIVIIMLLAPLFGFAIETFYLQLFNRGSAEKQATKTIKIIIGICVGITGIQIYLCTNRMFDPYWSNFFFYFFGTEWVYCLKTIAASILLLTFLLISERNIRVSYTQFALCLVVFTVIDLWPAASTMWKGTEFKVVEDKRKVLNIAETIVPESFKYSRTDELMAADVALTPRYFVGYADDWYFARYKNFFIGSKNETLARSELLGLNDPKKLFLSSSIDFSTISCFLQDSKAFPGQILSLKYSGDSISVNIESSREGYISFIDNWDPDWIAFVNKVPEKVDLLFGTFKSVHIPKGNSNVEFRYSPSLSIFSHNNEIAN